MTQPEAGPTTQQTKAVTRRWPYFSGGIALALVVLLGVVLLVRQNTPFEFDGEWMDDITEDRNQFLTSVSAVMAWIGGGWFGVFAVPLVVVGLLCLFRRFWAAGYFAVASAMSAGLVQLLKNIFDRPRPEEILIPADFGSFPSGHTANAATMAVVLGLLLFRWWVWAAGAVWVVLMALSRTYVGAHWVSDTIGGMILGAAVALLLWAPIATKLLEERKRRTAAKA
jgi:membrane-associated phospholipid phosphatase